ncbi:MAG: hypothetical protein AABX03_03280 [Nanoarchaeota archaeon]
MTHERKRLFVLEDDQRAISALEVACQDHQIDLDVATNFVDAQEKLNGNYDFNFFDFHVPYSDGTKTELDTRFIEDFQKYLSELPFTIPSELIVDIVFGEVPKGNLPIGYILARRMHDANRNYLITSSIFHNKSMYDQMQEDFEARGINAHLGSSDSHSNSKFTKEYWVTALEKIKEIK